MLTEILKLETTPRTKKKVVQLCLRYLNEAIWYHSLESLDMDMTGKSSVAFHMSAVSHVTSFIRQYNVKYNTMLSLESLDIKTVDKSSNDHAMSFKRQ